MRRFLKILALLAVSVQLTIAVDKTVGTNVTMPCSQIRGEEKVSGTMWYKNGSIYASLSQNKDLTFKNDSLEKKIRIDIENRSLTIFNLTTEDSANYTCKVYVEKPSKLTEERTVTHEVFVTDVPSAPGIPIVEDIEADQATVKWTPSLLDNNRPITAYILHISKCDRNDKSERDIIVSSAVVTYTIRELKPYTCYHVQVASKNSVGRSVFSATSDDFTTLAAAPSAAPNNFTATSPNSSEIRLQWDHPDKEDMNGQLKGYILEYNIDNSAEQTLRLEDPTKTKMVLQGLKPFTFYEISIKAYNEISEGPSQSTVARTAEGVPSAPRITHLTGRMSDSFHVHWEPPKEKNGNLIKYELQWRHNSTLRTRIIQGHLANPMTAFVTNLDPYTEYKLRVAAFTGGGKGPFSEEYPALTDLRGPSKPIIRNLTVLSPNTLYLAWDKPKIYYKKIDNYILRWSEINGENVPEDKLLDGAVQETILKLPENKMYKINMAGITQGIFSKSHFIGEFTTPREFVMGDPNAPFNADNDVASAGIIAGVITAIIVILVIVLIIVSYRSFQCRKCYQAAYYYLAVPSNSSSAPPTVITVAETSDAKDYPDILTEDFISHVENLHADSDFGFSQEFDDVNRNTKTDFKSDSSSQPENKGKNRYINIAAFDHSRVILKTELGRIRQSDYINANYIDGYKKPKAYIATQGPLPQSFGDFWRMIWEQNTSVIVMITNLMERGRRKCDQYWPNDGLELYGNMSVKILNTVPRAHYTIRIFSLRNMKVKKKHSVKGVGERLVYQYHYTEWPDHGVPDYTLPPLTFIQKSAEANREGGGPIVVHCSAGIGRTGTYIVIDSMIAQLKDKGTMNIPSFLLHIRKQRNFLVQTEDQYMFIHDVLVEYLLGGGEYTEVQENNLSNYISKLTQDQETSNGTTTSLESQLSKQYRLTTSHIPSDEDKSQCVKPYNLDKNRNLDLVPVNLKRVTLPVRPGIEGSDYINATYLQGYYKSNEFIITQHPLESTVEDFWRMVWDRSSPVIVVLSQVDNENFKEFWPERDNSFEVTNVFKLALREEDQEYQDNTRDFILESTQYDYTFMTKLLTTQDAVWPDSCTSLHNVFDLIQTAQKLQQDNDIGPVIVLDGNGGVQASKFCALWTLFNQLTNDHVIDVYQLAKLYHLKRPGIIGSQEDYVFLYKAIESLSLHYLEEKESVSSSPRHHNSHYGSMRKNGTLPHNNTNNTLNKNETVI
ncbi:tyrosine-protein phosphatase 99A isoform X1 [Patella vulgata]|uniref:tyrosine-protein phosphatase 99A isoform X1 n=1 Tax=Patella vulgata TaxID=6465 RepID=UPI00217FF7B5|nr:tyrosine-protein phosphatase 99A isoform X1 [Patella vulgata]